MTPWRIIYIVTSLIGVGIFGFSASAKEITMVGKSGYLVPRYVSLAKNTVNVRTGPDGNYPIVWVFKKSGLPVKVTAEYKDWRKIVDSEGATGWVWGPLLSSKRTGLIIADQQTLLKGPDINQRAAVIAEAGVVGKIIQCENNWCELNVDGFKGWLEQRNFWGTLEGEIVD